MLGCWLWWPPFILNVLTVCVFRVVSDYKIQRNVRWLACDSCLSLLCIWLNSNCRSIVQVGILKMILRWGQRWVCKWTVIYIYIYIYIFNCNSDGHEAVYIITYDDITEKSVSCSDVICLGSCWMHLQHLQAGTNYSGPNLLVCFFLSYMVICWLYKLSLSY